MDMQRISLGPEDRSRLKAEAGEGKDPEGLLTSLRQHCAAEWPFLFGEIAG